MADKKRIGIVITELGIPSEIWALRQCLTFRQIEPVLLYWKMHEAPVEIPAHLERRQFGLPFHRRSSLARGVARRLGHPFGALPDRQALADIRETISAARVDGLLCHFAWTGLAVSSAMQGIKPVVWHVHGRDVSLKLEDPSYRRAIARALPGVDHLVAVGRFQIERLRGLGLGGNHSIIPCGAPLGAFASRPIPRRQAGEPIRYIAIGRVSQEKGSLESLRAFEAVVAAGVDAELLFVGDGPLMAQLAAAVAASPAAGRVRLGGTMTSAEVAAELARSHVFVQHSRPVNGWVEGFGVSITEAGAAGLPLVVSRFGGIVDQVEHGANGLMFEPGDIGGQADFMLQLARDEDLRLAMGTAARKIAGRFDAEDMTRRLEEVLLGAVRRGLMFR